MDNDLKTAQLEGKVRGLEFRLREQEELVKVCEAYWCARRRHYAKPHSSGITDAKYTMYAEMRELWGPIDDGGKQKQWELLELRKALDDE